MGSEMCIRDSIPPSLKNIILFRIAWLGLTAGCGWAFFVVQKQSYFLCYSQILYIVREQNTNLLDNEKDVVCS